MRFRFDHPGYGSVFEVEDARLLGVAAPAKLPPRDEDALVQHALREPVGSPPLRDLCQDARSVLLLVDDATRGTRIADLLPHVAQELQAASIADEQVTVLTAQGTHRRMDGAELDRKLGPFRARWRVEQHDWLAAEQMHDFGPTRDGMPVVASRHLLEHDVVVGLGHVGVHGIMGYSGGAKIVLPGVAGAAMEAWTHWRATSIPTGDLMGRVDNPLRANIEEGARMAGLHAVLNVAMDGEGQVQHAAFGDVVQAQRDCARAARSIWSAPLPARADVVVVDAHPAGRDYWQSIKGLYCADLVVQDGGQVVLVAPNAEGVADNHPNVVELAGLPLAEIRRRVAAGEVEDVIGAAIAAFTARFRERFGTILVSAGVSDEEAAQLGFARAPDVSTALDAALRRAGRDAHVAVLRDAGGLLPVIGGDGAAPAQTGLLQAK